MRALRQSTLGAVLRQFSRDVAAYRATARAIDQPVVTLQRALAATMAIAFVLVTMVDPPDHHAPAVAAPASSIAAR